MSFLSKILSGFQSGFNWLVKTRVNVSAFLLLVLIVIAVFVGTRISGPHPALPQREREGASSVVPSGVDQSIARDLATPSVDTSSRVRTRTVTLPGERVLDSKILEVFPDVWFEKEFSFDNGDVYLVKYNPARNEWKFKDYTVQETVTKTVMVPVLSGALPQRESPEGVPSAGRIDGWQVQLGYKRVWEYNLASVGVNYEYGFGSWKWFGGVKGEYNFGLKKFQPALESGIVLHF